MMCSGGMSRGALESESENGLMFFGSSTRTSNLHHEICGVPLSMECVEDFKMRVLVYPAASRS